MRISSAVSGETVATFAAEAREGTVLELKRRLGQEIEVSRFRQRWFYSDHQELKDEDVLLGSEEVQLVILDFISPSQSQADELIEACVDGFVEDLEELLQKPIHPNVADECGRTALHFAAAAGDLECLRLLLEAGASIRKGFEAPGTCPIGHTEEARRLLQAGEDFLELAAKNGHLELLQLLHKAGFDTSRVNRDGTTALHLAARQGRPQIVKYLLDVDPDMAAVDGPAALLLAAENGHLEVVQSFLEKNIDEQTVMLNGSTALHLAASNGHLHIVQRLLQAGWGKDVIMEGETTALHLAAQKGHLEIVRQLLQGGADKDKLSRDGTALDLASVNDHQDIVTLLQDWT